MRIARPASTLAGVPSRLICRLIQPAKYELVIKSQDRKGTLAHDSAVGAAAGWRDHSVTERARDAETMRQRPCSEGSITAGLSGPRARRRPLSLSLRPRRMVIE